MKVRHALWLGLSLLTASWQAVAQDNSSLAPYEEYGKHLRAAEEVTPLTSTLFGDQTSLYNGSTEFDVTDIDLPGNSHLPVRLSRRLAIDDRRLNPGNLGSFGDWDVEVPYIDGSFIDSDGWTVIGANNSQSYARCSTTMQPYTVVDGNISIVASATDIWDGDQLHIPGEISEELLANTETMLPAVSDGKSYPWITKSFYRATCLSSTANGYPGESFVVVSPTGDRYTFNWAVVNYQANMEFQYPNPAGLGNVNGTTGRSHIFLLATEVDDRFGNWVKYTYNSSNQLTGITANDGRSIAVNWTGNYITSASTGTRTWSYGYTSNGALTYADTNTSGTTNVTINSLSSVTLPDATTWKYAITSGSLATQYTPPPSGDPPPEDHCQIDPLPNTGSLVYTIDSPSGAHGVFNFTYQRNERKYVPKSCTGTNVFTEYPLIYDFFDNFALLSKQITGAGLTAQNWTYDYAGTTGGYVLSTVAFPGNTETYIPQSATPYAPPKVVTVTDPSEITKYSYGVNYGVDEGRLLGTEIDALDGTVMKTVTNTYLPDGSISTQAFPSNAGHSVQSIAKNPMVGRLRPEVTSVTTQGSDSYTRQTNAFDVFAHPADVVRSNNIAGQASIEESTTYFNDYSDWVIGLPQQVTNVTNGDVESLNTYNPNGTLQASARFGETIYQYTYNTQGLLASFEDGNSNITGLSNYYRGVPQAVAYADNSSQSATVDDYGDITSVTDQNGYVTQYSYNAIGWPSTITYPVNDSVAWNPTQYTFTFVASAERGIGANHWRRTVSTGNYNEVTYFDAMLRPLLTDTNISNAGDISSASSFDWKGQTLFTSYPVLGTPSVGDSTLATGTARTYDVLGRVTQSQQDSELGKLTTATSYLSGNGTQVTDPKNNVTTTYYQAFDAPSFDAPIQVQAPTGITQTIARDLYGSPTSITQSGVYNGTETDTVTKSLYYDANHRLCRTVEPESGSTVLSYDGANNLAWSASGQTITEAGCGQDQVAAAAKISRTYYPTNRLNTLLAPTGTQSSQYFYDLAGHVTTINSNSIQQGYSYNHRGLMTGESLAVDGYSWSIGYGYDANAHISTTAYPANETIAFAPDARGRATQAGAYVTGIGYYPNDAVSNFTFGNGTVYVAEQNARQLTANFSYGNGSTTPIDEDLIYDPNANITNVNDLSGSNQRTKAFGYDALNRLTSAQSTGLSINESYTYDPLNNLRSRLTGGVTYTLNYDAYNRLNTVTTGTTTFASYLYDALGNRQSVTSQGVTKSYVFDQLNQLTQVTGADGYRYNATGQRVAKTPSGSSTAQYYFYNQAGQLMYEFNPAQLTGTNLIYVGAHLVARDSYSQAVPTAPTGFAVPASSNTGSAGLSWNVQNQATSYTVQQSSNGGAWSTIYTGSGTTTSVSGLAAGSYSYQVEACNSYGCSPWTSGGPMVVTYPPAAAPSLTVPGVNHTGAYSVTWTAVAGATIYTLQEQVNGGSWVSVQSAGATTWNTSGRGNGTYAYRVEACNAGGCSAWSGVGTMTITLPPAAPTLAALGANSTGSYTVSWSGVALATSYTLQENVNGGGWSTVQSSSATSWSTSGRGTGSYAYQVQACNAVGCSGWSATGTVTVTIAVPIAINGNTYKVNYPIPVGKTGYAEVGFGTTATTWEVFSYKPFATNVVVVSGAVPANAVTVQYTWTDLGAAPGESASTGTLSNPASSPTALSLNPTSYYSTSTYSATSSGNGEQYRLTVTFYNAAGAVVSTSSCTMIAQVVGLD